MADPNRHASVAQLDGTPRRRYYTGRQLRRALAIGDLRAMAHKRMPRFVLEYLEGGAEEEASLARDREAYAEWRFTPRQLVDVSHRSLATTLLGQEVPFPFVIAPTGLNGLCTLDRKLRPVGRLYRTIAHENAHAQLIQGVPTGLLTH